MRVKLDTHYVCPTCSLMSETPIRTGHENATDDICFDHTVSNTIVIATIIGDDGRTLQTTAPVTGDGRTVKAFTA